MRAILDEAWTQGLLDAPARSFGRLTGSCFSVQLSSRAALDEELDKYNRLQQVEANVSSDFCQRVRASAW